MRISFERFRQSVGGALDVLEEDGWIRFHRFSAAASDALRGVNNFERKSYGTAGICLRFRTDAGRLSFRYRLRKAAPYRGAWFDVLEDGTRTAHFGQIFGPADCWQEGTAEIRLTAGVKTVELWLPWSAQTCLTIPETEDGAAFEPVGRDCRILCCGDSITHGYYTDFPSLTYPARLAGLLGADVINQGIGGDRMHPERLPDVGTVSVNRITVAYGTNDWNFVSRDCFRENCRAYFSGLRSRYPDVPILAVSPIWRADGEKVTPFGAPVREVHREMEEILWDMEGITLADGWNILPHDPARYADAVHPNTDGFACYAQALAGAIRAADKKKGRNQK